MFNNFNIYNTWNYKNDIYTKDEKDFKIKEKLSGQFLDSKFKQCANSKIARTKYLDYYNKQEKKDNLVKLFITLTLPSHYHPYTNYKKENQKDNKNYSFETIEDVIESGFKTLGELHRYFYCMVKKKLKRKKINVEFDYLSVIEPHKSLIPHNHMLIYCTKEQVEIINESYDLTIQKYKLKQYKIETLLKAEGASTYYDPQ